MGLYRNTTASKRISLTRVPGILLLSGPMAWEIYQDPMKHCWILDNQQQINYAKNILQLIVRVALTPSDAGWIMHRTFGLTCSHHLNYSATKIAFAFSKAQLQVLRWKIFWIHLIITKYSVNSTYTMKLRVLHQIYYYSQQNGKPNVDINN